MVFSLFLWVDSLFYQQPTDSNGQTWLRLRVTPSRRSLWLSISKENLTTVNILPAVEQEQDVEDVETKRRSTDDRYS